MMARSIPSGLLHAIRKEAHEDLVQEVEDGRTELRELGKHPPTARWQGSEIRLTLLFFGGTRRRLLRPAEPARSSSAQNFSKSCLSPTFMGLSETGLDQIQNTYFGKADMMDEAGSTEEGTGAAFRQSPQATVQRMRMVFNRFRNSSGNEILQDGRHSHAVGRVPRPSCSLA